MTLAKAQEQKDSINDNAGMPATLEAVVSEMIWTDYKKTYGVIVITADRVAAYDSADIATKALYGQAAIFAAKEASENGADYETEFENKITELLA